MIPQVSGKGRHRPFYMGHSNTEGTSYEGKFSEDRQRHQPIYFQCITDRDIFCVKFVMKVFGEVIFLNINPFVGGTLPTAQIRATMATEFDLDYHYHHQHSTSAEAEVVLFVTLTRRSPLADAPFSCGQKSHKMRNKHSTKKTHPLCAHIGRFGP